MITHATRAAYTDATAAVWLSELQEAHSKLLTAIQDLAELTRGPMPEGQRISDTRWQVSEASLVRRMLWGRIHAYLSEHAGKDAESDLLALQEADMRLIRSSTEHVANWTAEAVMADWPGYCRASEVMRGRMIEAIEREKRLLYPILESLKTDRQSG
jgi:hypothetical protein